MPCNTYTLEVIDCCLQISTNDDLSKIIPLCDIALDSNGNTVSFGGFSTQLSNIEGYDTFEELAAYLLPLIKECCAPIDTEELRTGISLIPLCRKSDEAKVVVQACKLSDGTIEYKDLQSGATLTEAQVGADYCPECIDDCQCTTVFYEACDGVVVDNTLLLANSSTATFPDGSVGGATGVSYVQAGLEDKGSFKADGTRSTESQIVSNVLNGTPIGFDPLEGVVIGTEDGFTDIPPFSIQGSTGSVVQYVYTVYKCA